MLLYLEKNKIEINYSLKQFIKNLLSYVCTVLLLDIHIFKTQ
jgi:hypothetical protein